MIKRVLVPLDRTDAAEDILPIVATLATTGATVRLIHVAPAPENVVTPEGRRARIGVLLYRPPRDL